jgi:hypothetical protein
MSESGCKHCGGTHYPSTDLCPYTAEGAAQIEQRLVARRVADALGPEKAPVEIESLTTAQSDLATARADLERVTRERDRARAYQNENAGVAVKLAHERDQAREEAWRLRVMLAGAVMICNRTADANENAYLRLRGIEAAGAKVAGAKVAATIARELGASIEQLRAALPPPAPEAGAAGPKTIRTHRTGPTRAGFCNDKNCDCPPLHDDPDPAAPPDSTERTK